MKLFANVSDLEFEFDSAGFSESGRISVNGQRTVATLSQLNNGGCFHLLIGNTSHQVNIEKTESAYRVNINGRTYHVHVEDERTRQFRSLVKADTLVAKQVQIKAPMPGMIVRIQVREGQEIQKGDGLVVIEAMKMENEIRAPADCRVLKILRKEQDSVEKDTVLILVE
jgi:biotin carboxyl carrier protein